MARLDVKHPVLALDASYLIYHEYYSYKRRVRVDGGGSAAGVAGLFRALVNRLAAAYSVPQGNVVALLDCPRQDIWRREVYRGYKGERSTPDDFDRTVFPHVLGELLPNMGISSIAVPTAEADDLMAILASWAVDAGCPSVVVVTGDSDLAQLTGGAVQVVDAYGACVLRRSGHADARELLACKILAGDRSDGIPGVRARMGKKTALKTYADPALMDALMQCPEAAAAHARNTVLVDLAHVPDRIRLEGVAIIERLTSPPPRADESAELHKLLQDEDQDSSR